MANRELRGKKCLITGAASGIGRALAIALGDEGAELFLTDINAVQLQDTVTLIRDRRGIVSQAQAFDVSDLAAVQAFAKTIHAEQGSLDIVMNVAGIAIWGAVENFRHENWRQLIEVNLMGPIHVIECFIPPMIEAGKGGNLVNVSSAAGLFGLPWHAAYSATKFGLRGLSEVLRFDLKRHGINVSLVCPGGVDTGLVKTIQIDGIDMQNPAIVKLKNRFQKHAVTPEVAARATIKGMKAGKYMVFTSPDIRVGYWFQRKFAWPYEIVMQLLNNRLNAVAQAGKSNEEGHSQSV